VTATLRRKIAGKIAKQQGDAFEEAFEWKCRAASIAITRIPDGCEQGRGKLYRVKSPFDWFLSFQCWAFALDTKSTAELAFPHWKIDRDQVDNLLSHQKQGTMAGYVIYMRTLNAVVFVAASDLDRRLKSGKGSIKREDPDVTYLGNSQTFNPLLLFK
jgi:penicillin-binding protein-related factor A (putative recombinase)